MILVIVTNAQSRVGSCQFDRSIIDDAERLAGSEGTWQVVDRGQVTGETGAPWVTSNANPE